MKVKPEATLGQFEAQSSPGRRYEHTILQLKEASFIDQIRRRGDFIAITI